MGKLRSKSRDQDPTLPEVIGYADGEPLYGSAILDGQARDRRLVAETQSPAAVIGLYQGASPERVAEALDSQGAWFISPQLVRLVRLKDARHPQDGRPLGPQFTTETPQGRIKLAHLYRHYGFTYQEIGEELGVSHKTVWKWVNDPPAGKRNRKLAA